MKSTFILITAFLAGCCHCPKQIAETPRGYEVITGAVGNEIPQPQDARILSARGYAIGYKGSCNVIHTDGVCKQQETP